MNGLTEWRMSAPAIDPLRTDHLLDRVRRLPALTRQVVTLRKVYGLNQDEIAARLGMSSDEVIHHITIAVAACADVTEVGNEGTAACSS